MATHKEQLSTFVQERVSWPLLLVIPGAALFSTGFVVLVSPALSWVAVGCLLMTLGLVAAFAALKGWLLVRIIAQSIRAQVILHQAPRPEQSATADSFGNQTVH